MADSINHSIYKEYTTTFNPTHPSVCSCMHASTANEKIDSQYGRVSVINQLQQNTVYQLNSHEHLTQMQTIQNNVPSLCVSETLLSRADAARRGSRQRSVHDRASSQRL